MVNAVLGRAANAVAVQHDVLESGGDVVGVSVVVPVSERPAGLAGLYTEYSAPLRAAGIAYEFVFVMEPWYAVRARELEPLAAAGEPIRVLSAGQRAGETALLRSAIEHCRGDILITLPSYRRVAAQSLVTLLERLQAGADLVLARRWPRHDAWINRLQNWGFHQLLGQMGGRVVRDVGCGVRAFHRSMLDSLPLYGDFARFLPLLALREGLVVEEVDAPQHPADRRVRVYGPGVYLRRLIDVLNLFFLLKFTDKPLRFFGLPGSLLAFSGVAVLLYLMFQRAAGETMADRPMLLLAVMLFTLGAQAIALGLIGEIIVHLHAQHRRPYKVIDESDPRSSS
jgi:hypothetical protein